jgi:hypothetical protein
MSDGEGGFVRKVKWVITSPREGFKDIGEGDLRKGVAIVLLVAFLSTWAGMAYASKMEFDFAGIGQGGMFRPGAHDSPEIDAEALRSRMAPFVALGNGLVAVTRWLVPSVLVLLSAKVLVGQGSSRRMLAMTGVASVPRLAQQAIRVVDAYTIAAPKLAALMASRGAATGLPGRILNQAMNVIDIFGLATIVLTIFAVSVNYEADTRKSAVVTVAAYLIYVLLRAFIPII